MTITVSAEDIRCGIPNEPCRCPIALATRRVNPSLQVVVSTKDVSLMSSFADLSYKCYDLPAEAKEFVRKFDVGDDVQPFSFELEIA